MVFGPFLILDKSTAQALNPECYKYLGRYFSHLVTPILLRELTSDLAKKDKRMTDEELKTRISRLAEKTGSVLPKFLPDALKMACNDLLGAKVPMNGQISLEHWTCIDVEGGGSGVVFNENPNAELLRQWGEGHFSKEALKKGKEIRDEDMSINLEELCRNEPIDTVAFPKFDSLDELVAWVDKVHFAPAEPEQLIVNMSYYFLPPVYAEQVILRWKVQGRPLPKQFAPYATHVYRVDLIHIAGIYRDRIKKGKEDKTHLDIQYLYYLPFCHVFASGDKELKKLFPFFKKEDQELIDTFDFKADLETLSGYFEGLSEEEKAAFYKEFGCFPPELKDSFTCRMWKKFRRPRRPREGELSKPSPEKEAKIMAEFRQIQEAIEKQQTRSKQKAEEGNG